MLLLVFQTRVVSGELQCVCGWLTFALTSGFAGSTHRLPPAGSNERLATLPAIGSGQCDIAKPRDVSASVRRELVESGSFDLADTLTSDAHVRADLFQRHAGWMVTHRSLGCWVLFPFEIRPVVWDVSGSSTSALWQSEEGLRKSEYLDARSLAYSVARASGDWRDQARKGGPAYSVARASGWFANAKAHANVLEAKLV